MTTESESDEWERATTFRRPWKLSSKNFATRYGRGSTAIVDADGGVILFLDPSCDEYSVACTKEAADVILAYANGSAL